MLGSNHSNGGIERCCVALAGAMFVNETQPRNPLRSAKFVFVVIFGDLVLGGYVGNGALRGIKYRSVKI